MQRRHAEEDIETRKMFKEWPGKGVGFVHLGFFAAIEKEKGFGLETELALHTAASRSTLSVEAEVKTEITVLHFWNSRDYFLGH